MELTYQGGHDAVVVPLPFGREVEVAHGDSYDFPDEFAARLLEQPENWQRTPKAAVAKKAKQAGADASNDEAGAAGEEQ